MVKCQLIWSYELGHWLTDISADRIKELYYKHWTSRHLTFKHDSHNILCCLARICRCMDFQKQSEKNQIIIKYLDKLGHKWSHFLNWPVSNFSFLRFDVSTVELKIETLNAKENRNKCTFMKWVSLRITRITLNDCISYRTTRNTHTWDHSRISIHVEEKVTNFVW